LVSISGQTLPPKISVSPKSVNFGSVPAGGTSVGKMVTIKNTGKSDLIINSITISGTNAGEFSQTSSCSTIPSGGSCGVSITLSPISPGNKSATIGISSNDPKKSIVNVTLGGGASIATSERVISTLVTAALFPSHLIVKGNDLFWSDAGSLKNINKILVTGGDIIPLARRMGVPVNLIIYGQDIFWIDEQSGISLSGCAGSGVVWFLNKTSAGGITTVLAEGDNCDRGSTDILVDDTDVYWVNSSAGANTYTIKKVPIEGGASTALVSTINPIVAMARDGGSLYWIEQSGPQPGVIK
jgi:hypothetical protein